MERYDKGDDRFNLHLIIIYTGDVERAESVLDFGCLVLHPDVDFLGLEDDEEIELVKRDACEQIQALLDLI